MRTQQTPRAQLSSTARPTTSFVPAADPSPPSQRAASIGASVIDRQRTTAPRRARSRPGARPRATKSLRAAVSGSPSRAKVSRVGRGPADPANAPGPESARAAARTPPNSARIRATSRSDLSPRLALQVTSAAQVRTVRATAPGRTRRRQSRRSAGSSAHPPPTLARSRPGVRSDAHEMAESTGCSSALQAKVVNVICSAIAARRGRRSLLVKTHNTHAAQRRGWPGH